MKSICVKGEIHLFACLLALLPCVRQEIFSMSLLRSVLPFLTNQAAQFHMASAAPIFLGIFYHSCYGMTLKFELNHGVGVHF